MKKFLSFLLACSLFVSAACLSSAEDWDWEEEDDGILYCGNWAYRLLEDGTAEITEYTGMDTGVAVPAELDGIGVTGLAEEMTFPWYAHITAVSFPDSLRNIPSNPFLYCDALAEISVSPDHPSLGVADGVLFSKPDGRLIAYPLTMDNARYEIPGGIETIGQLAFYSAKALKAVVIPGTVREIGPVAFNECEALESVELQEGLAVIGERAFSKCTGLVAVSLPDSLRSVGANPFINCSALETVSVSPDHPLFSVEGGALFSREDKRLVCYPCALKGERYEVPQGTEKIGEFAFDGCPHIEEIILPEGVLSIGGSAFCWCENLKGVNIPDSVVSLNEYAFVGCEALTIEISPDSEFLPLLGEQELRYQFPD